MSVSVMGIFRFLVCLFLLLLSSASFASDTDNDGLDPLVADYLMAVGSKHACASDTNTIDCWGDNEYGQLAVPEINQVTELAAGRFFTCAIHNNSVSCWGDNSQNQLQPPVLNNPRNLTLGSEHACVLDDSGVVCWGNNNHGQIDVPELIDPIKIDAGGNNTCAISSNQIFCWGYYSSWDGYDGSIPEEAINPTQLSVGSSSICFLDEDVLNCVQRLELMGGSEPQHIFAEFNWSPISGVDILYSSGSSAHCISKNNQLSCYGEYWLDNQDRWMDPVIQEATNPTAVSVGGALCFFSEGMPKCVNLGYWGSEAITAIPNLEFDMDNDGVTDPFDSFPLNSTEWFDTDFDGIGNNADSDDDGDGILDVNDQYPLDRNYSKDTDLDGLPDSYEEATGLNKYIAIDASTDEDGDGLIATVEFSYGTSDTSDDSDNDGLLDSWEVENQRNPIISDYQVSLGEHASCIIDDAGYSCFSVDNGIKYSNSPVLENPDLIKTKGSNVCAIDDNGLTCWVYNTHGYNLTASLNHSNPIELSVGINHSCAIDDSGVICWGDNTFGQIDTPSLLNPRYIGVGLDFSCVLDNSEVICWGKNDMGQTEVPELDNPTQISISKNYSCAIDNTGVVCWGNVNNGLSDTPNLNQPKLLATSGSLACALDDFNVICWGDEHILEYWDIPMFGDAKDLIYSDDVICVVRVGFVLYCGGLDYNPFLINIVRQMVIDPDEDGYSNIIGIQGRVFGNDEFSIDPNEWLDTDLDGIGNNADTDDDGDNVLDAEDLFPLDASEWADTDNDGLGDNSDNCPQVANDSQEDMDADEIGDQCDTDTDGDGVENTLDVFPFDVTEALDSDADGIGNNADPDDDNDGFADINDDLPLDATEQLDTDADGIGNNTDTDDDGDGIEDGNDAFPLNELYSADSDNDGMADAWEILYGLNPNDPSDTISDQDDDGAVALQEFIEGTLPVADADNDGLSDNYEVSIGTNPNDADSDNDGVNDKEDALPLNSAETTDSDQDVVGDNTDNCTHIANTDQTDTDGDAIGDACDPDADNDGIPNDYEAAYGLNPADASDAQSDSDMDGLTALEEFTAGTSPANDDTDRDTLPDGWEVENGRDPLVADYQISVGYYHSCIKDDQNITCWGNNEFGQSNPMPLNNVQQIEVGGYHSCAVDDTGVKCWGRNDYGSINVPELINPKHISVGWDETCALDDEGVKCWGNDPNIPELTNPNQIFVSKYNAFFCATDDLGLVCWGRNNHGQTDVPELNDPYKVSLGWNHSCAIDQTGVVCWGSNEDGQINVPELSNPVQVSAGRHHTCAIDDSGVVCWGNNTYQINLPQNFNPKSIAVNDYYSCALGNSGFLCWNTYGVQNYEYLPELLIDPDEDGFSSQNGIDIFPLDSSEWQDTDLDGIGNNADLDDDNDGFQDIFEIQNGLDPLVANLDIDNDGITNELDTDNDNDGTEDAIDSFPLNAFEQLDHDNDGVGNNADTDDDGDGVNDALDLFPLDAFESADSDGDGVGDNADFFPNSAEYSLDSDLDQMPDAWERKYGLNPTDASDALLDQDNDGLTALEEYEAGTIPLKILDIDANGSFDALTDGLILLRYAFGLRGQGLVDGVISEDANRTQAADIEAYIDSLVPGL
jgi:alpha-tubulin suppressor-like RCC1 family protein